MKNNPLQPRYWLAIGLGIFSALVLSAMLMQSEGNALFSRKKAPPVLITTGTVKNGQTLAVLLKETPIQPEYIFKVQKALGQSFNLRRMQPGHRFKLVTSTTGVFQKLVYNTDPIHAYTVTRSSTGVYAWAQNEKKTVWMEKHVTCRVTESIYKDLLTAGYDEPFVANLVSDLADNIFAWRIDFFTEQRPGDEMEVLMEQEYRVGSDKPLWRGRGRILAASYIGKSTRKKENVAIRYQAPGEKKPDYFDLDGKAVRKAFLRAPFTHGGFRISSHFNLRRFHPIRRTYRPHHGIDYASARGTPVASVGKGKVTHAGWKGNYGKTIEIRHSNKYKSRYGHLSRIAVKKGSSVNQGQFIGRVGTTGLSTGPHLHFEMMVDGVRRNFLRMNFPSAKSVSAKYMDGFRTVKNNLMARLERSRKLASAHPLKSADKN